ncbi:MAG: acyltransferase family protein [Fibrobacteraceae bacterium]|nr:acyltransferase family protein [Fibrobacteraceae bacterium]MCF0217029.1 acyltransferase family protein [Fibrobacteraceae bacterium]
MSTIRDNTFDILKGIAILAVIIGHCEIPRFWGTIISSFHMPLFFFVSGYFLKTRPLAEEIRLSAKRLLVPYGFTALFICAFAFLEDLRHISYADGSYTQGVVFAYLLGLRYDTGIFSNGSPSQVGVLWFVLALFWARLAVVSLLNYTKSISLQIALVTTVAFAGIFLYKIIPSPFCILQSLPAIAYVYAGTLLRRFEFFNGSALRHWFPFLSLIWLYCLAYSFTGMAGVSFGSGFILDFFGALGATAVLFVLVKFVSTKAEDNTAESKASGFWRFVNFCGRYSLVLYCVHSVEYSTSNWKAFALLNHIPLAHYTLFQTSICITIAVGFTLVLLRIKPIRENIFQIHDSKK